MKTQTPLFLAPAGAVGEAAQTRAPRPAGTRAGGRADHALRPIVLQRGFTGHAEGSVLACFGATRVLCNASVLEKVPAFLRGRGRGWVTAEYAMLPRSTHTRSERESVSGRPSGRTQEIQRLIGRSLRSVVDLEGLGERTIHVDCDVLQADGGTRTAAITGAWLALRDAVDGLLARGVLAHDPLREAVAAVSVVVAPDGRLMLDPDYPEDSGCSTDMNVVMTASGGLVEVQGTAEGTPFSRAQAAALLDLAEGGIRELFAHQQSARGAGLHPLTGSTGLAPKTCQER